MNQDAKAYHYIDEKPWKIGTSRVISKDVQMWYSAATDLIRAHPGENKDCLLTASSTASVYDSSQVCAFC